MLDFTDSYLPFVAALARNQILNHPSSPGPSYTSSFTFSFSSPAGSTGSLERGARESQYMLRSPLTFAYEQYGRTTAVEILR